MSTYLRKKVFQYLLPFWRLERTVKVMWFCNMWRKKNVMLLCMDRPHLEPITLATPTFSYDGCARLTTFVIKRLLHYLHLEIRVYDVSRYLLWVLSMKTRIVIFFFNHWLCVPCLTECFLLDCYYFFYMCVIISAFDLTYSVHSSLFY